MILGNIFVWREKESMSFTNFSLSQAMQRLNKRLDSKDNAYSLTL